MSSSLANIAVRCTLLMALAVAAPAAFAQDAGPDTLVKAVADDIVGLISRHREVYASDSGKLVDLIETKVLPHFNFAHTTRIAMGANWKRASPEQQGQLIQEFRTLLVHTYSNALLSYRDAVIEYQPLRGEQGSTSVTVRSLVSKSGGDRPIAVDYEMESTSSGWKIYDLRIDNASLAGVYRNSFSEEVRHHGIDGLINLLSSKNHQNGAKPMAITG